jgi:hypothetical protein
MNESRREATPSKKKGSSLFKIIASNRSCEQAKIRYNYCTCMDNDRKFLLDDTVRQPALLVSVPHVPRYSLFENRSREVLSEWLQARQELSCLQPAVLLEDHLRAFTVTPIVRFGARDFDEWNQYLTEHPDPNYMRREVHELEIRGYFRLRTGQGSSKLNGSSLAFIARVTYNEDLNQLTMIAPPLLIDVFCSQKQIRTPQQLCRCLR